MKNIIENYIKQIESVRDDSKKIELAISACCQLGKYENSSEMIKGIFANPIIRRNNELKAKVIVEGKSTIAQIVEDILKFEWPFEEAREFANRVYELKGGKEPAIRLLKYYRKRSNLEVKGLIA